MATGDLQKDLIVLNEVYRVMAVDALASSHPLSSPASEVNTPAQISEVFDSISYSKVLRQWGGRQREQALNPQKPPQPGLWEHPPWPRGDTGSCWHSTAF